MSEHYDDDDLLEVLRRVSGVDEQLREGRVIADTAGNVLSDSLQADVQAGHDLVNGQVHAGQDVLHGLGQAGTDLTGGWSRAAEDAAHGDVLAVPVDLLAGQVKATAHVAESALTGVKDLAVGEIKAAGHLVQGAEDVGHDLLTGGAHLLGIGGDDKAGVLKKVGHERTKRVERFDAEQKRDQAQLQDIKRRLAANDPHAFATADEILDAGNGGLHFFTYFLPAYNAWTGAGIDMTTLRHAYNRERGLSFAALTGDAAAMKAAADGAQKVTGTLQQAYDALVPSWQGQAASQFETTLAAYFAADRTVQQRFGEVAEGLDQAVLSLQQFVYTKASTVSAMYAEVLGPEPGIDGVQALRAMVGVALNEGVDDEYRRWVLGMLHQPMHGRHGWDQDNDMWSSDKLDDRSRALAQQVASDWCNNVLAATVAEQLDIFNRICEATTSSVQQVFAAVIDHLNGLTDPFANLPTGTPADDGATTALQGGAPGGSAGGVSGGGLPGGPPSGFPGGAIPGGDPNSGLPTTPVTMPTTLPVTPTIPPVSTPTTPPVTPATPPVTTPVPAPVTNPDGSVTFGAQGDLRLGPENPDGSFDLVETSGGATHDYRVVFGPDGRPVITAVDGQPVPSSAADLTPSTDPTAAATGGHGSAGSHLAAASFAGGGVGSAATGGHSSAAASFDGGGGGASAVSTGGHAGGAVHDGGSTPVQAGVGTTYGAAAPDAGAAMPAGTAATAPAAAGGGHGSGAMGMPMMPMGGMGRGGGDQDLKRRYQPPREDVVDGDDLEEWDRLGPTIG